MNRRESLDTNYWIKNLFFHLAIYEIELENKRTVFYNKLNSLNLSLLDFFEKIDSQQRGYIIYQDLVNFLYKSSTINLCQKSISKVECFFKCISNNSRLTFYEFTDVFLPQSNIFIKDKQMEIINYTLNKYDIFNSNDLGKTSISSNIEPELTTSASTTNSLDYIDYSIESSFSEIIIKEVSFYNYYIQAFAFLENNFDIGEAEYLLNDKSFINQEDIFYLLLKSRLEPNSVFFMENNLNDSQKTLISKLLEIEKLMSNEFYVNNISKILIKKLDKDKDTVINVKEFQNWWSIYLQHHNNNLLNSQIESGHENNDLYFNVNSSVCSNNYKTYPPLFKYRQIKHVPLEFLLFQITRAESAYEKYKTQLKNFNFAEKDLFECISDGQSINKFIICKTLSSLNIYCTIYEAELIIKRYDTDYDNELSYCELQELFNPKLPENKVNGELNQHVSFDLSSNSKSNDNSKNNYLLTISNETIPNKINQLTRKALINYFSFIIESEIYIEQLKYAFYMFNFEDFSSYQEFIKIRSDYYKDVANVDSIANFLKQYQNIINKNDICLLLYRFSKLGVMSHNDFSQGILPKEKLVK